MPDWLASRLSAPGFFAVILQQIPGIFWALHPPKIDPFARNSGTLLVEILEKFFGIGTILALVIIPATVPIPTKVKTIAVSGAFILLATYYLFYGLYYLGFTGLPVLLGMAAFPPLGFLLVALYQGNSLAIISSLVFGAIHGGLTYANFAEMPAAP